MYFETYEKLKIYAAIYPDKVSDITEKELDKILYALASDFKDCSVVKVWQKEGYSDKAIRLFGSLLCDKK